MNGPRTWLPDGAATAQAEAAVKAVFERWSAHWFVAGGEIRAGGFAPAGERARALRAIAWHHCASGMTVGVAPGSDAAMGARAMAVAPGIADRTHADLAMLRALGGKCLGDLRHRLSALPGLDADAWHETVEGPGAGDSVQQIELTGPGDTILVAIALPAELLARLVKACLPAPPALPPLATPERALARTTLRLSAMPGGCQLRLAEVEALAPGDVVLLDRTVDQRLPLAIDYRRAGSADCAVVKKDDHLVLQFAQSPIG